MQEKQEDSLFEEFRSIIVSNLSYGQGKLFTIIEGAIPAEQQASAVKAQVKDVLWQTINPMMLDQLRSLIGEN